MIVAKMICKLKKTVVEIPNFLTSLRVPRFNWKLKCICQSFKQITIYRLQKDAAYLKCPLKKFDKVYSFCLSFLVLSFFIIRWEVRGCGMRPPRPPLMGGSDRLGSWEYCGMPALSNFGLWRPGGAFFQIGLGCVMSHHQSPHRRALHNSVLILAGKFKMECLPTVSH